MTLVWRRSLWRAKGAKRWLLIQEHCQSQRKWDCGNGVISLFSNYLPTSLAVLPLLFMVPLSFLPFLYFVVFFLATIVNIIVSDYSTLLFLTMWQSSDGIGTS